MSCLGVIEPVHNFMERRDVLVAHSVSYVDRNKTFVQASSESITLRRNERVEQFSGVEALSILLVLILWKPLMLPLENSMKE